MDVRKIFQILGIEETKDEEQIKQAYRSKLVSVNPEENPEGFIRLRTAYEEALVYVKEKEELVISEGPVDSYIRRVDAVYQCLPSRLDISEWEALLSEELLDDLEYGEDAKWRMFVYLADHYRLPAAVWQLFGRVFRIPQEEQEFKEHLPENFVDYILWKLTEEGAIGDFAYDGFAGDPRADYDAFIEDYNTLIDLLNQCENAKENGDGNEDGNEEGLKAAAQKIAGMDTYEISHPWFALEKARYAMLAGSLAEAEQLIRVLWEDGVQEDRILLGGADILIACGKTQEAREIYESFTDREEKSGDIYHARMKLAKLCFEEEKWLEARELVRRASQIYDSEQARTLFLQCDEELIPVLTEAAEELDAEKARILAWCYVQTQRSEEGYEFFKAHPGLMEDTAKCHQALAVLYQTGGHPKEAMEELAIWRKLLLLEEEPDVEQEAESYDVEARCLVEDFHRLEEAGEDTEALKEAILAALEKAVSLQPEDINYHMSRLMFARDIKDYESMVKICKKIIELEHGYFWAYFYIQEAYEKLRMAQEVVDTFYDAKEIYDQRPEIYERAARVFSEYNQPSGIQSVLTQAEEAGVDSPGLQLRRLELMRRDAGDARADGDREPILKADEFARKLIADLEEKRTADPQSVSDEVMAELYLERVYIQEEDCLFEHSDEAVKLMGECLEKALAFDDDEWTHYYTGRYFMKFRDDCETGFKHLKICEERGMTYHYLYYLMGWCQEDFGHKDEAAESYKKAMEQAPDNSDYAWRVAWIYRTKMTSHARKQYGRTALEYLNIQIDKFGKTALDAWQLADIYAKLGEFEKALPEIDLALEERKKPPYYELKGKILTRLNRRDEALTCFEKALEIARGEEKDYGEAYRRIYEYYLVADKFAEGAAWFEADLPNLLTEKMRRENLNRLKRLYVMMGDKDRALLAMERKYGAVSFDHAASDSWEEEAKRIEEILEIHYYFAAEGYEKLLEQVLELIEGDEGKLLKESRDGKRQAYKAVGMGYRVLLDDEKAVYYMKKALSYGDTEDTDFVDLRRILNVLMRCLWHLGRIEEAAEYAKEFRQLLEEYNSEDCLPGETFEEGFTVDNCWGKVNLSDFFLMSFFSGDYEKARVYGERLAACEFCWNCMNANCVEECEMRGYLALHRGDKEEARKFFEIAMLDTAFWNLDAYQELKRLEKEAAANRNC